MDSTFISAAVQNIWNAWNIRVFMILSLCIQLILTLTAPFRRKTSNGFFILVVWSAYLLADWAVLFVFGLISNAARCKNSNNNAEVASDVMAFWAAFLLIPLGGPDSITAFSLEDNALWHRHLVELIAQLFAFLYIFVKTLPHNKLLVPTMLIFLSGVIKYGERTRALYLASLENLKKSIKKTTIFDPPVLLYNIHEISKCLIVDITLNLSERNVKQEVFLTEHRPLKISMIFWELRCLYEVLYTKIKGANSGWGKFARSIAYFSTVAAFILFCLADKQEFHGVDIAITYALFWGFFILHVSNLLMLSSSQIEKTEIWKGFLPITLKQFILLTFGQGFLLIPAVYALYRVSRFFVRSSAIERFFDRQWSEKMGSFNLLSHCFKQGATTQCQKPGFIWNKLAEMRHTSREDFDRELFNFAFEDLKGRTEGTFDKERRRKVYEARGDCALEKMGCCELKPYINNLEYDYTLFIWHVATEICYNIEEDVGDADVMKKRLSKVLSDYMMYLLVKQPKLMSPVAGITHIRYEDICVELKLLRRDLTVPNMKSFCVKILKEHADIPVSTDKILEEYAGIPVHTEKILEEHADITDEEHHCGHSVLKDSCKLVRLIREKNNRWEIIFNVWMELLSYAASHCRADSHARLLSEGSEFITFVWLLMVCSGIGA